MLKNMKKSTKSNLVTLSIVVGFYIFIQILGGVGLLTNSFSGQLVPICAYVILAVSLNLTVGILGELSLGHAGFMSVGAMWLKVEMTSLTSGLIWGSIGLLYLGIVTGGFRSAAPQYREDIE